jgi:hypothetical protein
MSTSIAATTVTGKAITGYASTTGALAATDTILDAIEKLNGNSVAGLALKANLASPTFTGTVTAPTFSGALSGNATSATTATTANSSSTFTGNLTGDVTSSGMSTSIAAGTVTGKQITGFSSTTGTLAGTDTILQAIQKLNGNNLLKANSASPTFTGTVTAPTFSGALSGNATSATTANSSATFTGNLTGDVTSTGMSTTIAASTVTGKAITGYVSGAGTVSASDTILQAIQKLNGNAVQSLSSPTFTGTVGIGATSPLGKLHITEATGMIANPNQGTLVLEHSNSGGASSITFRSAVNAGSDYGYIQYQDASTVGGAGESSRLIIATQNDGDDHIALMPGGNVGIGTLSPGHTLDVAGSGRFTGALSVNGIRANTNTTYDHILNLGASDGTVGVFYHRYNGTTSYTGYESHNVGNTVKTPFVLQEYGGNVGIRTSNPAYDLDVSGGGRFTNGLTVGNGIYSSDWVRFTGTSEKGIYWADFGGGWTMNDTTWLRSYGGKNIYTAGSVLAGNVVSATSYLSAGNGDTGVHQVQISDKYIWKQQGQWFRFGDGSGNNWDGINAAGFSTSSDRRIKEDIRDVSEEAAMTFLEKSKPVKYKLKIDKKNYNYGFIAQDLLKLGFSEIVTREKYDGLEAEEDSDGFKSPKDTLFTVNYNQLTSLMTKGMQTLLGKIKTLFTLVGEQAARSNHTDEEIEKLKNENKELKAAVCQMNPKLSLCH